MKGLEYQFSETFTVIERAVAKYIRQLPQMESASISAVAEAIQQSVIDLGESIEELYKNETGLTECAGKTYERIIRLLEDYCELLYQITTGSPDEYKELENRIKKCGGDIAIALRFDIKTGTFVPGELEEKKVYDLLGSLSSEYKDKILLSIMTTRSYRKYKPVYPEIDDVAIVSQGPVDYTNDFTIETMYYYRKLYPNITLIISTWSGEANDDFRWKAESIGVQIVEGEKPAESGYFNHYMQIRSSRNGVEKAAEDPRIRYILKTRNDQRFNHPDFIVYLRNLLKLYPAKDKKMESRLVYMGFPSSMFSIPFHLTDFMLFGTVKMMCNYWSAEMEACCYIDKSIRDQSADTKLLRETTEAERKINTINMKKKERMARMEMVRNFWDPERALAQTYFERCIHGKIRDDEDILQLYWKWLRDGVVIADERSMLWIWDKREFAYNDYNVNYSHGDLNHFTWLDLYLNGIPDEGKADGV